MPPKADYWKHFKVVGVVAYCLVAECQQPNISLGALPKPGEYIQKANLDPVVEKRYRGSFDHLKLSCLLKGHP